MRLLKRTTLLVSQNIETTITLTKLAMSLGMSDERQELGYSEVAGIVFVTSDEVGTAFANECLPYLIRIAAGSLLITSLIISLTAGVILHVIYGLQVLNRVRQQPMHLRHSMPT